MTIALVILLAVGSVAFLRAAIIGQSPLEWLKSLIAKPASG